MGTLTCNASKDTSSVWQTDTIVVYRDGKKASGIVFGTNNKDNPFKTELIPSSHYKIDITRTCHSGSTMSIPMYWRGVIEIHNASGADADLQMLHAQHAFDTVARMNFTYLDARYTFDNTSNIVIDDHGPNPQPPPVVYTRQILTDHGQFWVPNDVQVWHENDDPSRQGYFNCPQYVNNQQCLPGMDSPRDGMSTSYGSDKFRYDSKRNIDLMSLTYDWNTRRIVGPFI